VGRYIDRTGWLLIVALGLTGHSSHAQQLYKWVDERGVTNYSNQPPADPKAAKTVRPVEDRLSVYSPDQGLIQAIEDNQKNFDQRQRERARVQALENQLEAERRARQQSAAAVQDAQQSYDRCMSAGRLDCGAIYGEVYTPIIVAPPRHRRQNIPQPVLTPGTTAGNVTADSNYIPGNSASVPSPPPREARRRAPEGRPARVPDERR
jgi:uncharacterized protein DUF4124